MSSYGSESWGSRKLPLWLRVSRDASGRRESRKLPLWSRVSRDASGRPSRDASWRSTPQITKPVGPIIVTGVLTVARFVGKVGCYLLLASLSGRLTAFHPPDHKAGGSRHCDGGALGGEICWGSRKLPLGRESLGTPQGVPLGTPHGVPPPQITKPVGPVIATGVLTVARFVPHGNWMTHMLANSPVGDCWARRPATRWSGPRVRLE